MRSPQGVADGLEFLASIRQAVLDCYARAGTPFMVNAGCEIPSRTPLENLRALCEPVPYVPG